MVGLTGEAAVDGKISVLMGVYNAENVIINAVETIEKQTERNREFIICDDGSTDGTYGILLQMKQKYSDIILLRNTENQGLACALNRCLSEAEGEFIARMDVDDLCVPERFAYQKNFLTEHPEYDLVGSQMIMLDDNGEKTFSREIPVPTGKELPLKSPFAHPTVLMRRYVLERLGGYSVEKYTRRCEDLELWYRFFAMGMKGYNLPQYLYIKKQGLEDYRRRKVIHGVEMFFIHLRGLRMLHSPAYKYVLAVKPVVSAMIPKRIMMKYHKLVFGRGESKKSAD